ncbi:glycine-rich domain-containing protein [Streptomyces sp. RKAG337]|uniref:glycine-rich domain-containing protein n=1 Tax=Streptomyces sp. RKAG337 TaxID=2893404 RepID=UPI002033C3A2|nr:hypothetical protein [Streptomyces sp. RKAG337]MCM2425089.1 hypothetical protein [Streptomyces sp. RKAG337]
MEELRGPELVINLEDCFMTFAGVTGSRTRLLVLASATVAALTGTVLSPAQAAPPKAAPPAPVVFTSSGGYAIPKDVKSVLVTVLGAGAGGRGGNADVDADRVGRGGPGGGGGGMAQCIVNVDGRALQAGEKLSVAVGRGGLGGRGQDVERLAVTTGGDGGQSSVDLPGYAEGRQGPAWVAIASGGSPARNFSGGEGGKGSKCYPDWSTKSALADGGSSKATSPTAGSAGSEGGLGAANDVIRKHCRPGAGNGGAGGNGVIRNGLTPAAGKPGMSGMSGCVVLTFS